MAKRDPHSVNQGVSTLVTREYQMGNTRIIVHSPTGFIDLTPKQQSAWLERAYEAGDPIATAIVDAVYNILVEERK